MLSSNDLDLLCSTLTFWDDLTEPQKQMIPQMTSIKTYKKGTHILNTETECVGVIVVKTGALRTYIMSEEGKDITLYRLHPKDTCILSASCLLRNITFDVAIDAEEDSEIFLLNASTFSKLMDENIYVENFSYRITIDKFSEVMWTMEQILFMKFDQRLSIFLLDESVKTHSDTILLTHAQIAKYIGSAREVVSRMLKYFEEEGAVRLFRGGIELIDKSKLKKYL